MAPYDSSMLAQVVGAIYPATMLLLFIGFALYCLWMSWRGN